MGTLPPAELAAREPILRVILFVLDEVDWTWAFAALPAIVLALSDSAFVELTNTGLVVRQG
jgi:hypothetical protein